MPDGSTKLIAGIGGPSYTINGVGAGARFGRPMGLTATEAGTLYIADTYNHRIRKIDAFQIYINTDAYPAFDGTITLERDTTYTRMDSDAGGMIDTAARHLTFGKNDGSTIDSTFNGVINGTGDLTVNAGAGHSLTLRGVNTYTGGTVVQSGTLALSGAGALSNSSAVSITGGSLDISGAAADQTVGDLSISTGTTVALGARSLTFGTANNTILAGTITGSGALLKQGAGSVVITSALAHSGGTTINAGELAVNGSIVDDVTNNGILSFSRSDDIIYGGVVTGAGSVVQKGSGRLVLTGTNTYSGDGY